MINTNISVDIHDHLNNGRTVNKTMLNNGKLIPNFEYNELDTNEPEYKKMYEYLGHSLIRGDGGEFFYLSSGDGYNEAAVKIATLLTIIMRHAHLQGFMSDHLERVNAGISEDDTKKYEEDEDTTDLLNAEKLTKGLWQEMLINLRDRNIMFVNGAGRLVLTESGSAFFTMLTTKSKG
jgi:hypothetical protein